MGTSTSRKPRADALANRQKVLQAARLQFAEDGPQASLNEIARRAGVGAGTLYRHFPSREDLVAAVYANEVEELGAAAGEYLRTMDPDAALDAWGERFLAYASTKRGLGEALKAMRERGDVRVDPRGVLMASMDQLIDAGRAAGTITSDARGEDLLLALSGLWSMPDDEQFTDRSRRLMRMALAGVRHG